MKYANTLVPLFISIFHILGTAHLEAKLPQNPEAAIEHLQKQLQQCETEKKEYVARLSHCGKNLTEIRRKLAQCQFDNQELEDLKEELERIAEKLQDDFFGGSETSSASSEATYLDSNESDAPDSPSIYIGKLEDYNITLEERLKDCDQAEAYLHKIEAELAQKQEALRNCQQLSGAAKVGAGAAGLSQLKNMDKNLTFNNPRGGILKALNEGGFILFKQAAKETIPQVPIFEWNGHSLLDSHELTEITAEGLKTYAHDRNIKHLALTSAQVYARVKIIEQLDKCGITKPLDNLEYNTRIVIRGLLCKGVDLAIGALFNLVDHQLHPNKT